MAIPVPQPDDRTQARIAVAKTEAASMLSWVEKEKVADAILSGKSNQLKTPQAREALVESLVTLGITSDFLAQKLKEGLDADETQFFAHQGIVNDSREKIDWSARHSYLKTALKLVGAEGSKSSGRMSVKNFVYKPMLRDSNETVDINPPKEQVIKRRMAAAKHLSRKVAGEVE